MLLGPPMLYKSCTFNACMKNAVSLEEGVQLAIKKLEPVTERPLLVAVYGWPNGGKSYLIGELADHFERQGIPTARGSCAPVLSSFEMIKNVLPVFQNQIIFYHCGWDRTEEGGRCDNEDPNVLARAIANKRIHLNIGVYNPEFCNGLRGAYDILIANNKSKRK